MIDFLIYPALALYIIASLGLLFYGLNCYPMLIMFARKYSGKTQQQKEQEQVYAKQIAEGRELPSVTIQIPLYNEYNVAERVIRAAAAIDYPRDQFEVQVLDDSTDETIDLVDQVAKELRNSGIDVTVFRRTDRSGYKAGALKEGLKVAKGDYIGIFDSDFIPPKNFLTRILAHLVDNPEVGLAQARWTHLNDKDSLLTRAQAIGIDGHFAIEQCARSYNNLFLNFNGTGGVWRREAINDAGGWQADTITEDMDLSYRSQLAGWKIEYVPGIECPAELPDTYRAFKSQQFRWAKGSIQTSLKLMGRVFRSDASAWKKFQSIFHFTHYAIHPLMLVVSLTTLASVIFAAQYIPAWFFGVVAIPLIPAMLGPSLFYLVSQMTLYPQEWHKRIILLPVLMTIGFGICLSNTRAVLEALAGKKSAFIRTPKAGDQKVKQRKTYSISRTAAPLMELALAAYCLLTMIVAVSHSQYGLLPFFTFFTLGFFTMGKAGLREQ